MDTTIGDLREKFTGTADGLGLRIDPGILDTVLFLNALGFKTTQSCEGHAQWGLIAPWVEIAPDIPDATSWYKIKKNRDLADAKQHDLERKAHSLLAAFYTEDMPSYEFILIVTEMAYSIRIHSIGLIRLQSEAPAVKALKLPLYQNEMHRFTQFLKKRYSTQKR